MADSAVTAEYVARLEEAVVKLAVALQTHRADMHNTSSRPCSTCRLSALALEVVGVDPYVEQPSIDLRSTARTDAIAAAGQAGIDRRAGEGGS